MAGFHAIHNRNEPSNSSKAACYPAFFNEKIHIEFWYKGLLFILPNFAIFHLILQLTRFYH